MEPNITLTGSAIIWELEARSMTYVSLGEVRQTVIRHTSFNDCVEADLAAALENLLKRHAAYIEALPGESGLADLETARAALRKAGRLP